MSSHKAIGTRRIIRPPRRLKTFISWPSKKVSIEIVDIVAESRRTIAIIMARKRCRRQIGAAAGGDG